MAGKRKSGIGSSISTISRASAPAQAPTKPNSAQSLVKPAQHAPSAKSGQAPISEVKSQPRHEDIARAAYLRWLREGGDPATNWLAAEAELTGRAALKL